MKKDERSISNTDFDYSDGILILVDVDFEKFKHELDIEYNKALNAVV